MNCDQTFEVLTRGPFPSGDDGVDIAVESHLTACHDCRQLSEALRPAVGLIHEAMAETESLSLPGYRGDLSLAGEGPLRTITAPAPVTSRVKRVYDRTLRRRSATLVWAFAATCLLGFVLGLFGESIHDRHAGKVAPMAEASASQSMINHTPDRDGRLLLASLQLPAACRDVTTNDVNAIYQCCTQCHAAADKATAPQVRLATLTKSCMVCHTDA